MTGTEIMDSIATTYCDFRSVDVGLEDITCLRRIESRGLVVCGTSSGMALVYAIPLRGIIHKFKAHASAVGGIGVSADDKRVMSVGIEGDIAVRSVADWSVQLDASLEGGLRACAFSPNRSSAWLFREERSLTEYDFTEGVEKGSFEYMPYIPRGFATSADGTRVAVVGRDTTQDYQNHMHQIEVIWVATRRADGRWQTDYAQIHAAEHAHDPIPYSLHTVCLSRNGQHLAFGGTCGLVYSFDGSGPLRGGCYALGSHRGSVCAVAISEDGCTLASAGEEGYVKVWYPPARQCLQQLPDVMPRVSSLCVAGDGSWILAGAPNGLWLSERR